MLVGTQGNLLYMWETSARNHPREQSDETCSMTTVDDMEKTDVFSYHEFHQHYGKACAAKTSNYEK